MWLIYQGAYIEVFDVFVFEHVAVGQWIAEGRLCASDGGISFA